MVMSRSQWELGICRYEIGEEELELPERGWQLGG
jgi:hypothetical protein